MLLGCRCSATAGSAGHLFTCLLALCPMSKGTEMCARVGVRVRMEH